MSYVPLIIEVLDKSVWTGLSGNALLELILTEIRGRESQEGEINVFSWIDGDGVHHTEPLNLEKDIVDSKQIIK